MATRTYVQTGEGLAALVRGLADAGASSAFPQVPAPLVVTYTTADVACIDSYLLQYGYVPQTAPGVGAPWGRYLVSNDPYINAPYRTVQSAIDDAAAVASRPATIMILPSITGSYAENLSVPLSISLRGLGGPDGAGGAPARTVVLAGQHAMAAGSFDYGAQLTDLTIDGGVTLTSGALAYFRTQNVNIEQSTDGAAAVLFQSATAAVVNLWNSAISQYNTTHEPAISVPNGAMLGNLARVTLFNGAGGRAISTKDGNGAAGLSVLDCDVTGEVRISQRTNVDGHGMSARRTRFVATGGPCLVLRAAGTARLEDCEYGSTTSPAIDGQATGAVTFVGPQFPVPGYAFRDIAAAVTQAGERAQYRGGQTTQGKELAGGDFPYTALPGDTILYVTSTAAARVINLPDTPDDGTTYEIIDASNAATAVNYIRVARGGASNTIDSPAALNATTFDLTVAGGSFTITYRAAIGRWRVR